jgi:hypothetical protein
VNEKQQEYFLMGKLIWGNDIELLGIILGFIMSYVNERELDEVRTMEEGFKKAYSHDTEGTIEAVEKLRYFALQLVPLNVTAENELDIKALTISIGDIGRVAAENNMEPACVTSVRAIGDIAVEAANQERESLAIKASTVLGRLSLELAEKNFSTAAKNGAESLGSCGKVASSVGMEMLVTLSEIYLMQLSLNAMDKSFYEIGYSAVDMLGEIGASSAEQEMELCTTEAAILLEDLGNSALRKKDEAYAKVVIQALGNMGAVASQHNLISSLVQIAWSLETIRVLAREMDLKIALLLAKEILDSLSTAGMLDEARNLEKIQEIKKFHQRVLKKVE